MISHGKRLMILGGGTGGTILANRARRRFSADWDVMVVDPQTRHVYQPGLLFLPFGGSEDIFHPRRSTFARDVTWIQQSVERVDPATQTVALVGGERYQYDLLVIASGSRIRPDLTEGLTGPGWHESAFDFYTFEGAKALRDKLAKFEGGRLVVNVVEMPIKCPVAPLEFTFLADDYLGKRGIREKTEIVFSTPLDGPFTKPIASAHLSYLLKKKNIRVETEFGAGSVDGERRVLSSYDGREIPYDLLVTIPTHSGAEFVAKSQLGNELDFIPTDNFTLAAKGLTNVFVLGDATNLPSSKAGSVAHFQAELLVENLVRASRGEAPEPTFDGHSNCFVETGHGRALLIDFNYDTEPLPGEFPFPGIGPVPLLSESRRAHWGKRAFEWIYWHGLLPGRPIPIPARMSMRGKHRPHATATT